MNFSEIATRTGNRGPVRVLHVIHWPVSGIVSLMQNIASAMAPNEVEAHFLFFEYAETADEWFRKAGYPVFFAPSSVRKRVAAYRRQLREVRPDILHTHSFQPLVLGGLLRTKRIRHVTTVHNDYPFLNRRDLRSLFKRALMKWAILRSNAAVVAVSSIVGERIEAVVPPETRQRVIPNGIVLRELGLRSAERSSRRNALRLPEHTFVFVSAGRLDRQKGYHFLIEAASGLSQLGEEFCVVILGAGSELASLKGAASGLGLAERFIFSGYSKNIWEYFMAADAYVCSSLYEGKPLAVMEAMWAGLPIVSTRVGGVPDFVEDEISGLVVPPGDVCALRHAMQRMMREPELRQRLVANGRRSVAERCDVRKTSDAYLQLYKEILGQEDSVPPPHR